MSASTAHVKRRAFWLFVMLAQKEHKQMFPDMEVRKNDFNKYCGVRWQKLTVGQKQKFEELWLKENDQSAKETLKDDSKSNENEEAMKNEIEARIEDGVGEMFELSKDVAEDKESEVNKEEENTNLDDKLELDQAKAMPPDIHSEGNSTPVKKKRSPEKTPGGKPRKKINRKKMEGVKGVRPPYALFLADLYEKARASGEISKIKGKLIMKEAHKRWSELSDEEKQKYKDRCEADKLRYKREKEEHQRRHQSEMGSLEMDIDNVRDLEEVVDSEK